MPNKLARQYTGPLNPEQIAYGMNAAARCAQRLYDDAALLADAGRFPSACALAALSIEESGKLAVLRRLACRKTDKEAKEIWRDYRNHKVKNASWIALELASKGAKTLQDLSRVVDPASDHPEVLDTLKQLAFYTDCYGSAHWSEPTTAIDEALCRQILLAAYVLIPRKEVAAREIELWVKHVGDHGENLRGAAAFFEAMTAEGLSDHDPAPLEKFLGISVRTMAGDTEEVGR